VRYLKIDLISSIFNYIDEEKINFELNKDSDQEFLVEDSDKIIFLDAMMKPTLQEILYAFYSPNFEKHMNIKTINDFEQLLLIIEDNHRCKIGNDIENTWLIVDEIGVWEQKNKFILKQSEIEQKNIYYWSE
jgi:hypothetical protein